MSIPRLLSHHPILCFFYFSFLVFYFLFPLLSDTIGYRARLAEYSEQIYKADPSSGQLALAGLQMTNADKRNANPPCENESGGKDEIWKPARVSNISAWWKLEAKPWSIGSRHCCLLCGSLVPSFWLKKGIGYPYLKREGRPTGRNNFHSITLFSVAGKVLARLLLMQIRSLFLKISGT